MKVVWVIGIALSAMDPKRTGFQSSPVPQFQIHMEEEVNSKVKEGNRGFCGSQTW